MGILRERAKNKILNGAKFVGNKASDAVGTLLEGTAIAAEGAVFGAVELAKTPVKAVAATGKAASVIQRTAEKEMNTAVAGAVSTVFSKIMPDEKGIAEAVRDAEKPHRLLPDSFYKVVEEDKKKANKGMQNGGMQV